MIGVFGDHGRRHGSDAGLNGDRRTGGDVTELLCLGQVAGGLPAFPGADTDVLPWGSQALECTTAGVPLVER